VAETGIKMLWFSALSASAKTSFFYILKQASHVPEKSILAMVPFDKK